jgi:hypothetical protein
MYLSGFVTAANANVLAGTIFEFLARNSRISVGVVGDVALSASNTFTFQIADTVIASNAQIFGKGVLTTSGVQNLGPVFPDDFFIQNEPGLAGQRLTLQIARATGNLAWAVIINEVG